MDEPGDQSLPMVWRIPPWQPAALILLATAMLALDLYASLSSGPLVICSVIAAAALVGAALALRYQLVADADGIWVRNVFHEYLVAWRDVADVELAIGRRNAATVRISRRNGSYVEVPPSLLLPTRPTSIVKVRKIMGGAAKQLLDLAHAQQQV